MPPPPPTQTSSDVHTSSGGHDKPLVVGLTKPVASTVPASKCAVATALNASIEENVQANTKSSGPANPASETIEPPSKSAHAPTTPAPPATPAIKKEKAPKQPKAAAAPAYPLTPAVLDLRVGHILRAIVHPNADSLFVSTIALGDAEGTENTQKDEETGKIVRTVCSGLNGLVPLEKMQNRKVVVVANLKPVNMRSIKSAAMVLAASPKAPEGAEQHAHDRVVELVLTPNGAEAGDKVFFEGWPYGSQAGPERLLNPKKKQWEAIQPGFYTTGERVVAFDAKLSDGVEGGGRGDLVVEGKGQCTVETLKDATVR